MSFNFIIFYIYPPWVPVFGHRPPRDSFLWCWRAPLNSLFISPFAPRRGFTSAAAGSRPFSRFRLDLIEQRKMAKNVGILAMDIYFPPTCVQQVSLFPILSRNFVAKFLFVILELRWWPNCLLVRISTCPSSFQVSAKASSRFSFPPFFSLLESLVVERGLWRFFLWKYEQFFERGCSVWLCKDPWDRTDISIMIRKFRSLL